MGRPTVYSEELADIICDRIADGESLRAICSDEDMPARSTVRKWSHDNPSFSAQYARAYEEQADHHAELVEEVAYDPELTTDEKRVRIDAHKWRAGQQSRKWGNKQQVEHSGSVGIGTALDALPDD